jgi:hypothetical protein
MYYRIVNNVPGYPPEQQYMVAAYETLAYEHAFALRKPDGSRYLATLEEARQLLPPGAKCLSSQPEDQFLELWEA